MRGFGVTSVSFATETHMSRIAQELKHFNDDGTMKPIHTLHAAAAANIAGFEVEERFEGTGAKRKAVAVVKKVRLVNQVAALDMAARVTGEFAKDNEQRRPARAQHRATNRPE